MAGSFTQSCGRWLRARCEAREEGSGDGEEPRPRGVTMLRRRGGIWARALGLSPSLAALAFLGFLSPGPAEAQTVQGQLLDRDTGQPVEGALVLLLGSDGKEFDGYLSNDAGRFLLRAPEAGTYLVRADRIGYETVSSEAFSLAPRQIFGLRLEMAETAIQLDELRVEGEQQCIVRPEEGLEVARVWEEARKALTAQEWTDREGLYRFQVVNYERELDNTGRRIESETRRVRSGLARNPIESLPAEELMEEGFIRPMDDGGWQYFGPDAAVLLSDPFLDTHCFHLRNDPNRPESLGLAFEPARITERPDIEGTLWLDRNSASLQFLEFGYTWAPYAEAEGFARGRVEFEGLPNGSWIVRSWWIRMPELAQQMSRARAGNLGIYVKGVREAGAEVSAISTLDRQQVVRAQRGFLTGLVWDSTRYGPLAGANVYLSGTSYSTETNGEGRFVLEDLPGGVFTASFTHPRLDSLGIFPLGVEVEITPGDIAEVTLGTPSLDNLLSAACREQDMDEGSAVVTGMVRDASTGEPIPEATVRLRWLEIPGGTSLSGARDAWVESVTDGQGRYSVCGLPTETRIIVQATFLDEQGDSIEVHLPEDSFTVVDLEISRSPFPLQF